MEAMDLGYYILDLEKKPVRVKDCVVWAKWFERFDRRRVAHTDLNKRRHIRVSTVFLGLDHRDMFFHGDGPKLPPLIFESMIFGTSIDGRQWRYSTWEEAVAGHQALVTQARQARQTRATSRKEHRRSLRRLLSKSLHRRRA